MALLGRDRLPARSTLSRFWRLWRLRRSVQKEEKRAKIGVNEQSKKMGPVLGWPHVVEMGGSRTLLPSGNRR